MARLMVKKGLVQNTQEAFDKYLADGAAVHLPKDKISVAEGLALIHGAGGVASLAHPNHVRLVGRDLLAELKRLKSIGLDAVECYYSQHSVERTEELLGMASEAGLLPTGGSDFHGITKPTVRLGEVLEGKPVPMSVLDRLKQRKGNLRT